MASNTIHIVDRFGVPWSGSALSALALQELLSTDAKVRAWSIDPPHPCYQDRSIRMIASEQGDYPRGGTLIVHGNHFELGPWTAHSGANRVILICNVHGATRLFDAVARIRQASLPEPELVFRSHRLREISALPGLVEPPLIDTDLFRPASQQASSPFTVGRVSRDHLGKHAEDDPSLYRMLALSGCRLRIMGGTCLNEHLGPDRAGIELLETGHQPVHRFLQELDCFFYRTGALEEAFARVVLEAMASGLPVVCHRRGGHTEWIRHGENGFLFDTQEEACDLICDLHADPRKRRSAGRAARECLELLAGEKARADRRKWYLDG